MCKLNIQTIPQRESKNQPSLGLNTGKWDNLPEAPEEERVSR